MSGFVQICPIAQDALHWRPNCGGYKETYSALLLINKLNFPVFVGVDHFRNKVCISKCEPLRYIDLENPGKFHAGGSVVLIQLFSLRNSSYGTAKAKCQSAVCRVIHRSESPLMKLGITVVQLLADWT